MYDVKVFNGTQGLSGLETIWRNITSTTEDVRFYHMYEWYQAYLNYLEKNSDKVYFFLVIDNDEPIAIVPLKHDERTMYGVRLCVWETPRTSEIDLYDIISTDKNKVIPAFRSVIRKIKSTKKFSFDMICLTHVLEEGNASKLVQNKSLKYKIAKANSYSKSLSCFKDGKFSLEFGTGKFRRNLRRLEKRLNEKGNVTYKSIHDLNEMQEIFPTFLEVEASGWKGEVGTKTAIKFNTSAKLFYEELLRLFGVIGKCSINLLQVDGKTIAAQYCLLDDNGLNLLKIGHDPVYQDTSPGFLLIKYAMENITKNSGIKELSFVTGAEWNDIFRPRNKDVFTIMIFNTSIKGILIFTVAGIKEHLKKWLRNNNNQHNVL